MYINNNHSTFGAYGRMGMGSTIDAYGRTCGKSAKTPPVGQQADRAGARFELPEDTRGQVRAPAAASQNSRDTVTIGSYLRIETTVTYRARLNISAAPTAAPVEETAGTAAAVETDVGANSAEIIYKDNTVPDPPFKLSKMPWCEKWEAAGKPEYGSAAYNEFKDNYYIEKGYQVVVSGKMWFKVGSGIDPISEETFINQEAFFLTHAARSYRSERGEASSGDYKNVLADLTRAYSEHYANQKDVSERLLALTGDKTYVDELFNKNVFRLNEAFKMALKESAKASVYSVASEFGIVDDNNPIVQAAVKHAEVFADAYLAAFARNPDDPEAVTASAFNAVENMPQTTSLSDVSYSDMRLLFMVNPNKGEFSDFMRNYLA
jgi:hypothetical protein